MLEPSQAFPRIFYVRGVRVMLDYDLAQIYGTSTKRLNEAVRRNGARFPEDFMFQLTSGELEILALQGGEPSVGHGGRRSLPFAFTEYGAIMLSAVLKTPFAVQASIAIARAFVRLRRSLAVSEELRRMVSQLEQRIQGHDADLKLLFDTIQRLEETDDVAPRRIGFEAQP